MKKPTRLIFDLSKPLHKYTGLIGLVYFLIMGISGVLINHPSLISSLSIPHAMTPPSYRYDNWNRLVMREMIFSEKDPARIFIGGRTGVWQSLDNGGAFALLNGGFPAAPFERDTYCLLLSESGESSYLYAGTRSGLFRHDFSDTGWQPVGGDTLRHTRIVDLVAADGRIWVFTPFSGYRLDGPEDNPVLHPMKLTADVEPKQRAPLYRLLLQIHDGSVLGLSGRLFMDAVGLALIFLSVSAGYIWYVPWRKKRFGRPRARPRFFRFFYRYHLKVGIYTAIFLVVIALTGVFLRPPLIAAITGCSVPAGLLNNHHPITDWPAEITRAVHDSRDDCLVLATRKGFYRGPADGSRPFVPYTIDVPVSGMGVNILECLTGQRFLVGSFSGLYIWDVDGKSATDVFGRPVVQRGRRGHPPGMAAGAAVHNGRLRFWADYRRGLQPADTEGQPPSMPRMTDKGSRMSLWHFLFELHNGRIFRDWLGGCTWLVVPLGGLVLVIALVSGGYDWLYRKTKKIP